jgi:hypothetical protein
MRALKRKANVTTSRSRSSTPRSARTPRSRRCRSPKNVIDEIRYFEQQEADRVASGDTSKERFNQCLGYLLIAERDRGEFIQRWLDTYTDSPEFKGQWMVFESFGSAAGFDEKFSALLPDGSHYEHYQATLSRNLQLKNKGA